MNACLRITSWDDMFCLRRVKHYYGKLQFKHEKIDIVRPLTKEEAEELSDEDYTYKEGQQTFRWDNCDELIKEAQKVYKEIFPEAEELIIINEFEKDE